MRTSVKTTSSDVEVRPQRSVLLQPGNATVKRTVPTEKTKLDVVSIIVGIYLLCGGRKARIRNDNSTQWRSPSHRPWFSSFLLATIYQRYGRSCQAQSPVLGTKGCSSTLNNPGKSKSAERWSKPKLWSAAGCHELPVLYCCTNWDHAPASQDVYPHPSGILFRVLGDII